MKHFVLLIFLIFSVFLLFLLFSFHNQTPEQYRLQLEETLQNYLQQDVELGPLTFEWKGIRPYIRIEGVRISRDNDAQILLQAAKVYGRLRLSGIFLHQILFSHVVLEDAHFGVIRESSGKWNWDFLANVINNKKVLRIAGWRIRSESMEAPSASVYYADRSQLPYYHQEWKRMDFLISQASDSYRVQISPQGKSLISRVEIAFLSSQQLVIKGVWVPYGQGEGSIDNLLREAHFKAKLRLQGVNLDAYDLKGEGRFYFEAFGEGLHPESLKRNLILKGQVDIRQGSLLTRRAVFDLLQSVSAIPGFSNLTRRPFVGEYSYLSEAENTIFENLKADYRISNGKIFTENFELEHTDYKIVADGQFDLTENKLEVKGDCVFKKEFSKQLIDRVRDTEVLLNTDGEITIPFSYQGTKSDFRPAADLTYIVNRLIRVRGQELASRGVQKLNNFLEEYKK